MQVSEDATACLSRARRALANYLASPDADWDPMLPAAALYTPDLEPPDMAARLLKHYQRIEPGHGRDNARRYRWGLGFRAEAGHDSYAGPSTRGFWRPKEAWLLSEHPDAYARRLILPLAVGSQFEYWSRVAEREPGPAGDGARDLLAGAQPVAENDVARWIVAVDPWADTFALWVLTNYPLAHARLRDLVFSLAVRYGQIALRDGLVRGIRHPFWQEPLVSASAHLALALWRLGIYPTLLPGLLDFVRSQHQPDGGWADPGQPSDVLTSLAAAELLSALDPTFDPDPVTRYFERCQEPTGWWRALNPEVPWLTGAVAAWLDRSPLSFTERFRWPTLPVWSRDRTTGLPMMAVFDELAVALASTSGLAQAPLELAFIDLAGFGTFNNDHGMDAGDRALAAYASALLRLPRTMTIRAGGDELLVLGVPGERGYLEPLLRDFMDDWQDAAEAVGVPRGGVVPRILLTSGQAGDLRQMQGRLGTAIGPMKQTYKHPGPNGVLVWL